jgi:NADPH:quinone reductase-like Zn-dependent oxidoreductase
MSRAVVDQAFGGPEVLELRDAPEPHAGPGEVRVRVAAAGLDPVGWIVSSSPGTAAHSASPCPPGSGTTSRARRRGGSRR